MAIHIEELLLKHKLLTTEQLSLALAKQIGTHRTISDIIVELGFMTREALLQFSAEQLKVPYIDLKRYPVMLV